MDKDIKFCGCCNQELPVSLFNYKSKAKGTFQSYCRECNKKYKKSYFKDRSSVISKKNYLYKKERKLWWREYLSYTKCEKCGENHWSCLEFHHINPEEKEYTVSYMINKGMGKERILKEMNKCIILCSNCHRKLHLP